MKGLKRFKKIGKLISKPHVVRRIRFFRQNVPATEPIEQNCAILEMHENGALDVLTNPVVLSNRNGPTVPLSFYRLEPNGKMAYHFPKKIWQDWAAFNGVHPLYWQEQTTLQHWGRNVPTWQCVDYMKLAFEATILVLLAHRFDQMSILSTLPRDVIGLIGREVLASAKTSIWETILQK